jgi:hypothetical protein
MKIVNDVDFHVVIYEGVGKKTYSEFNNNLKRRV